MNFYNKGLNSYINDIPQFPSHYTRTGMSNPNYLADHFVLEPNDPLLKGLCDLYCKLILFLPGFVEALVWVWLSTGEARVLGCRCSGCSCNGQHGLVMSKPVYSLYKLRLPKSVAHSVSLKEPSISKLTNLDDLGLACPRHNIVY